LPAAELGRTGLALLLSNVLTRPWTFAAQRKGGGPGADGAWLFCGRVGALSITGPAISLMVLGPLQTINDFLR